ncbi:hypothetical protein TIFTF001_016906 [Ficus carica]|uniref:Uncharacterized protein n=1 Tax=Ficus carica TaxID=3494 RepID=A0AA88D966_FICCA|nr:hypothetical protein TIFTF001_016906 [Ficus carica]
MTDFEVNEDNCDNQVSWMKSKHTAARVGKQFESLNKQGHSEEILAKEHHKTCILLSWVPGECVAEDPEEDGEED